jgi:RNA polymerase sigma factor (sigma-70 family)
MNQSVAQWFTAEILPHEAALTRYLTRVWQNLADVPDLRQEIYVLIYESATQDRPRQPKAFLFTTARNLLTDQIRRRHIVSINYTRDLESLDVLIDELSPEHRLNARQELRSLSDALDTLPDICKDVIWLRRVEGLSQQETALQLGIKEGTIESHMCRGMRTLAKAVIRQSVSSTVPSPAACSRRTK